MSIDRKKYSDSVVSYLKWAEKEEDFVKGGVVRLERCRSFLLWYGDKLIRKKSIRRKDVFESIRDVVRNRKKIDRDDYDFLLKFLNREDDVDRLFEGWGLDKDELEFWVEEVIETDEERKERFKENSKKKKKLKRYSEEYHPEWVKNIREGSDEWRGLKYINEVMFSWKNRDSKLVDFFKVLKKVKKESCSGMLENIKMLKCMENLSERGGLSKKQFEWFLFRLWDVRMVSNYLSEGKMTKKRIREEYEWVLNLSI